jgi:hypothetical protein
MTRLLGSKRSLYYAYGTIFVDPIWRESAQAELNCYGDACGALCIDALGEDHGRAKRKRMHA